METTEPTVPVIPAQRGESILVIDDEAMIRRLVRTGLQKRGYNVVEAADGAAGIRAVAETGAEMALVILDLTMPKMSGEETFGHLRRICPGVPVILTSGYNEADATRKFVGKGLASFLQKPFTIAQLLTAVGAALHK